MANKLKYSQCIDIAKKYLAQNGFKLAARADIIQYYRPGKSNRKIRINQDNHFMDLFIEKKESKWETFLQNEKDNAPEKNWNILVLRDKPKMTKSCFGTFYTEEDVCKCCNDFIELYDKYETSVHTRVAAANHVPKNKSCSSKNTKKIESQQKDNMPMPATNRQTDARLFPTRVSNTDFSSFCNTEIQVPEYKNGKKTGNKFSMKVPQFASFAYWTKATEIGDNRNLNFPCEVDDAFLKTINANVIFVGLNISRDIKNDWSNFHDSKSKNDPRLRWAIQNNELFWKVYMTDLLKGLKNSSSDYVKGYFLEKEPPKPHINSKGKKVGKQKHEGFQDKIKDIENRTFVSLKEHGDNFYKEMKLLEEFQNKAKPIVLILLGVNMEKVFLNRLVKKSESLKKWKEELGERLIITRVEHYAAHCRAGESEEDFRERYCESFRVIATDLMKKWGLTERGRHK